MEHLTKHQLVLLALLLCFVTSIATGIVTVSLMDQAPRSGATTINQVIERTIERVVPDETQKATVVETKTVVVRSDEYAIQVVEAAKVGTVRIGTLEKDEFTPIGWGIVLSGNRILTDAGNLSERTKYAAETEDKINFEIKLEKNFEKEGLAIYSFENVAKTFTPLAFLNSPVKLGQSVVGIRGKDTLAISLDTITGITSDGYIELGINNRTDVIGAPVLGLTGEVIGIHVTLPNAQQVILPADKILAIIAPPATTE